MGQLGAVVSNAGCCCCTRGAALPAGGSALLWLLLGCLLTAAAATAGFLALRPHARRHATVAAAAELASWDQASLQALLQDSFPAWVGAKPVSPCHRDSSPPESVIRIPRLGMRLPRSLQPSPLPWTAAPPSHLACLLLPRLPPCPQLADPEMMRQPEWTNKALATVCPHLCSAASRQAAAGGQLERQFNSSAVWRPRFLANAYVHLQGVHLGPVPPRLTAVKAVQPPNGSGGPQELSFDCSFAWRSAMDVKLLVSLLPEQAAEAARRRGWLRRLVTLVSRAVVVKARAVPCCAVLCWVELPAGHALRHALIPL